MRITLGVSSLAMILWIAAKYSYIGYPANDNVLVANQTYTTESVVTQGNKVIALFLGEDLVYRMVYVNTPLVPKTTYMVKKSPEGKISFEPVGPSSLSLVPEKENKNVTGPPGEIIKDKKSEEQQKNSDDLNIWPFSSILFKKAKTAI